MEDQTVNQLWKKSEGQGHRLRRPHDSAGTDVTLPNSPSNEVNKTVKAVESRLSADAKEFYPAGYVPASSPAPSSKSSSVQDRLKIKHNQPQNQNEQRNNINEGNCIYQDDSQIEQDKRRLENMITTLIYNPGQFDDLLHLFVETFKPYLENHDMINIVAEMLVFEVIICRLSLKYSLSICYSYL